MSGEEVIKRRRWRRWVRVMLPVNIVGTLLAYVIMLGEVESVVVSGPLLFMAGMVTVIGSRAIKFPLGVVVGWAQVGVCVLFVSLVNILEWGPRAAERPFALMGIAYMLGFLPAAATAMSKVPEVRGFGYCARCGYMLYGLTEPRCPECGEPFDPAWLPRLALSAAAEESPPAADS